MDQSLYYIQQHSFDISFFAADKARELQDQVSRLFYSDLTTQMEQLFDRLIPAELILKFDKLTINAGSIPYDCIDKDLVTAIIQALEEEIKTSLIAYGVSDSGTLPKSNVIKKADYLGATEYFLIHGTLPWWITGMKLKNIEDIIAHILTDHPGSLKALLLHVGRYSSVQRRLARQFSWSLIKRLIALLEPQNAEFIFQYHDHVLQTQQKKNIIKTELNHLGTVMWELIFKILLSDSVGRFNRKMFLKSNIIAIANYFNISYAYLIDLLNVAPDIANFKSTDLELVELLQELWEEDAAENPENTIYKKLNISDTYTIITINDHLKIIYYYLSTGSIPASIFVKDEVTLNSLMLELIIKVPEAIIKTIRSIPYKTNIGEKITAVFDNPVITKIIRLLEPSSADYIITYHTNIQKLNQEQQTIKADSTDFSKVIWTLIINYLLSDRGSDFNRQMFLESNIRSTASHYNLNLHELAVTLRKAVVTSPLNDTQFAHFIIALDAIIDTETTAKRTENTNRTEKHSDAPPYSKQQIKHALLYWLKHGTMPWWYKQLDVSLQNMFIYLVDSAYDDALEVIIYAGTTSEFRQRLLNTIPPNHLLKAFEKLPDGKYPVKIYNTWHRLLNTDALVGFKQDKLLLTVILNLFWKNLSGYSYKSFNLIEFLESSIGELSLWRGIEPAQLFKTLFDITRSDTRFNELKEAFDAIAAKSNLPGFDLTTYVDHPMQDKWLEKMLFKYSGNVKTGSLKMDEEAILQNTYSILEYFLTHNKLPSGISVSQAQMDELLRLIVLKLFKSNPLLISRLFMKSHNAAAGIYIHNLFTITATIEAQEAKQFLNDFINDDILLYLKSATNQSASSIQEYISQFIKQLTDKTINKRSYELFKELMQQQSMAFFAARYYTNEHIYAFIEFGNTGWGRDTISFLQQIEQLLLSTPGDKAKEDLAFMLKQFNLTYFTGTSTVTSPEDYIFRLLNYYKYYFHNLTLTQLEALIQFNADSGAFSASFLKLFAELSTFFQQLVGRIHNKQLVEKSPALVRPEPIVLPISEKSVADMIKKSDDQTPKPLDSTQVPDENEPFYVKNAGIVLLHPFLTTYFSRLGMLKDGKFGTEAHQLRAVHLLQYLCDSTTDTPEHDLALNKLLSGLALHESVPAEITLTPEEIQVSAELLKVVTQQWEKLNNTSVEGLQTSFLQRHGVLTYTQDNWHLRVEPRSYDLLLQTLPWGLSLVKTTWMDTMLTIEWAQV